MGYFPNGTSSEIYFDQWCSKCQHMPEDPEDGGCSVWLAHLLYNYDFCNEDKNPLDILIPRSEDGLSNEKCTMFFPRQGRLPGEERPAAPKIPLKGEVVRFAR